MLLDLLFIPHLFVYQVLSGSYLCQEWRAMIFQIWRTYHPFSTLQLFLFVFHLALLFLSLLLILLAFFVDFVLILFIVSLLLVDLLLDIFISVNWLVLFYIFSFWLRLLDRLMIIRWNGLDWMVLGNGQRLLGFWICPGTNASHQLLLFKYKYINIRAKMSHQFPL